MTVLTSSPARKLVKETLTAYFKKGYKDPSCYKIGVEWEKIGIYRTTGEAIRYSGPAGVAAILESLIRQCGWQADLIQNGQVVALKKGFSRITLEPGGQIELSGQTYFQLKANREELANHLQELKRVSSPYNIAWLGVGVQPFSKLNKIEWTPKERYRIMREALRREGELTYNMMKQTASTQVSIDYKSEADACLKLRLATTLAPFFAALFSNSCFFEGKRTPYHSMRYQIWQKTDAKRTGLVPQVFQKNFSFAGYTEYALNVPLFFIQRNNTWLRPEKSISFGHFLKNGYQGHEATLEDWELHLSTIFTDARLKHYIEIRSIDCLPGFLAMAAPALIKGLFYGETTLQEAADYFKTVSYKEIMALRRDIPKKGMRALFRKKDLWPVASFLTNLAQKTLKDLHEEEYLELLRTTILKPRRMPAEILAKSLAKVRTRGKKIEALLHYGEF